MANPHGQSQTSHFQEQIIFMLYWKNQVPTFLKLARANLGSLGCLPSQWKERGTFGRVIWFGWVNLPLKLPLSLCCLEESPADWSEMSFRWGSEINPTFS